MTVKQCQFLCKFKCNLQNCDTDEDAEDEPYGWWKMVEWPRRSLVRLVQWLLGRLTWTCTFVWRLYAFPELNRCQSNQIKQDVTTFEANFKTNYQPKNWSNFLTPVGRHFAPCVLDPKFRLFLEIFTFYTSQATVKKIDVFPFQQTSSNFQKISAKTIVNKCM